VKRFRWDSLFARNLASLSVLQAANILAPMITIPYLLRSLGANAFGRLMLAQASVTYVCLLVEFGFNLSAARHIAEARAKTQPIAPFVVAVIGAKALLFLSGAAALIAAVVAIPALRQSQAPFLWFLPLALGALTFPEWLFRGLERMAPPAMALLAARGVAILATFLSVHGPRDITWAALIIASTPVLAGLFCAPALRGVELGGGFPTWRGIVAALREGWDTFLSTAATSLYSVTNAVLVGAICGPTPLAFFSTADKIRTAGAAFIPPVTTAAYPRVVRAASRSWEDAARLAWPIAGALCALAVASGGVLFIFAPQIVALVAGPHYGAAIAVLRIMSCLPLVLAMNSVLGLLVLLPRRQSRAFSRILTGGGLLNVALLIPLAGRLGAAGAAISLVTTEIVITAAMAWAAAAPAPAAAKAEIKSLPHAV
jgi:O-antigen/teichoic acid export membrane protein